MLRASDVLAYTISHGDRRYLERTIPLIRSTAGCWFDWAVWLGAPSPNLERIAQESLDDPRKTGIQRLVMWKENRGQHHATNEAMQLAKTTGYKWILRLDDDIIPKTKRFLLKMVERLGELKNLSEDPVHRIIAAPKIVGLRNPLSPIGAIMKGQKFSVEIMDILGGACRLHPVDFLGDYIAPIYDPIGRGDPQSIVEYTHQMNGLLVRFPDIRIVHRTSELEGSESDSLKHQRVMSHVWPWLESPTV